MSEEIERVQKFAEENLDIVENVPTPINTPDGDFVITLENGNYEITPFENVGIDTIQKYIEENCSIKDAINKEEDFPTKCETPYGTFIVKLRHGKYDIKPIDNKKFQNERDLKDLAEWDFKTLVKNNVGWQEGCAVWRYELMRELFFHNQEHQTEIHDRIGMDLAAYHQRYTELAREGVIDVESNLLINEPDIMAVQQFLKQHPYVHQEDHYFPTTPWFRIPELNRYIYILAYVEGLKASIPFESQATVDLSWSENQIKTYFKEMRSIRKITIQTRRRNSGNDEVLKFPHKITGKRGSLYYTKLQQLGLYRMLQLCGGPTASLEFWNRNGKSKIKDASTFRRARLSKFLQNSLKELVDSSPFLRSIIQF